jgi:hypothetical protein
LQSDGELAIASMDKDEAPGNLVTRQYRLQGIADAELAQSD